MNEYKDILPNNLFDGLTSTGRELALEQERAIVVNRGRGLKMGKFELRDGEVKVSEVGVSIGNHFRIDRPLLLAVFERSFDPSTLIGLLATDNKFLEYVILATKNGDFSCLSRVCPTVSGNESKRWVSIGAYGKFNPLFYTKLYTQNDSIVNQY